MPKQPATPEQMKWAALNPDEVAALKKRGITATNVATDPFANDSAPSVGQITASPDPFAGDGSTPHDPFAGDGGQGKDPFAGDASTPSAGGNLMDQPQEATDPISRAFGAASDYLKGPQPPVGESPNLPTNPVSAFLEGVPKTAANIAGGAVEGVSLGAPAVTRAVNDTLGDIGTSTGLPGMDQAARITGQLGGGIKAINWLQGLFQKGFGIAGTLAKGTKIGTLMSDIASGVTRPTLSNAVNMAAASTTATALEEKFKGEDLNPEALATSAAFGGLLGATQTTSLARIQEGEFSPAPLRAIGGAALVGAAQVTYTGARTGTPQSSTPFPVTGNPYFDQALFDVGINTLMHGHEPKPGDRVPFAVVHPTKGITRMGGTILSMDKTPDGFRISEVVLDNGMRKIYEPGKPIILTEPPPPSQGIAGGKPFRDGDMLVKTDKRGNSQAFEVTKILSATHVNLRPITEIGQPKLPSEIEEIGKIRKGGWRVVDGNAALDVARYGQPVKIPGPGRMRPDAPDILPPSYAAKSKSHLTPFEESQLSNERRVYSRVGMEMGKEQIKLAMAEIDKTLPEDYKNAVGKIVVDDFGSEGALGSYDPLTRTIYLNANRTQFMLRRGKLGYDALWKAYAQTIIHEYSHAYAEINPEQWRKAVQMAGWKRSAETPDSLKGAQDVYGNAVLHGDNPRVIGPGLGGELWERPIMPTEDVDSIVRARRNPMEDMAHSFDRYLTNPEGLLKDLPQNYAAIEAGLLGPRYAVAGLTARHIEASSRPQPVRPTTQPQADEPPTVPPMEEEMWGRLEALGPDAGEKLYKQAIKHAEDRKAKLGGNLDLNAAHPDGGTVLDHAVALALNKHLSGESKGWKNIIDQDLTTAYNRQKATGATSVDLPKNLGGGVHKEAGKTKQNEGAVVGSAPLPPENAAGSPKGIKKEVNPTPSRKIKSNVDRLWGHLVGTDGGAEQITQELKRFPPNIREAARAILGVDEKGRPGPKKLFREVALSMNLSIPELATKFRYLSRDADGNLRYAGPVKGLPNRLADPYGNQLLFEHGQLSRETAASLVNKASTDPVVPDMTPEEMIAEMHRYQRVLAVQPDNKLAQQALRLAQSRVGRAAANTPDPDMVEQSLFPSPPPKKVYPYLRQFKTDNLIAAWKKAQVAKDMDKVAAFEAELRGRGVDFRTPAFPNGEQPKAGSPRGNKPNPPDAPNSISIIAYPEHRYYILKEAASKGDLAPLRFEIRDANGHVIGSYTSHPIDPFINPHHPFLIDPIGYRDENGNEDATSPLRFRVSYLGNGREVGVFTKDVVKDIVNHIYIPGLNLNTQTNTLFAKADEVGQDSPKRPPIERVGDASITENEFSTLPGPEQVSHLQTLLLTDKINPKLAWDTFLKYHTRINNFPERINQLDNMRQRLFEIHGPPGVPGSTVPDEVLRAWEDYKVWRETSIGSAVRDYKEYWHSELGGMGTAYGNPEDLANFEKLARTLWHQSAIDNPDGDMSTNQGKLSIFDQALGSYSPNSTVRQMYLYGHPVLRDFYVKVRGADQYFHHLVENWIEKNYKTITAGLSPQEKIAIGMQADGRYEAGKKVTVSKVALLEKDMRGRRFLSGTLSQLMGRPMTAEVILPEMTPALQERAVRLRSLLDEMFAHTGLPPGRYMEDYLPHIFTKSLRGEFYELPTDMNMGRDIFFKHFMPRSQDAPGYELQLDDVMDLYARGLARKITLSPIVREFSNKEVLSSVPAGQREYLQKWLRFVVGQPDPADRGMSKMLMNMGINSSPGMLRNWLYRTGMMGGRPFTQLSHAIRGWQFMAKIEWNLLTGLTNTSQSFLTTVARHGIGSYVGALRAMSRFSPQQDPEIQKYFRESGIGTEITRSDVGAELQMLKKGVRKWGRQLFQNTENFNKAIAFASEYKISKEAGYNQIDAIIHGTLESDLTQFNMTKSGRLPLVRTSFGSLMFQFSPYRFEMAKLIGDNMMRSVSPSSKPADKLTSAKFLWNMTLALHFIGGLDAHVGPFLRDIFKEDDSEYHNELLKIADMFSMDWMIGKLTQGAPLEWGHFINPLNLFNPRLQGPIWNIANDMWSRIHGLPANSTGSAILTNLPAGVQAERTLGPEIQDKISRPLLGQRAGTLHTGPTTAERLFGKLAKRGKHWQQG